MARNTPPLVNGHAPVPWKQLGANAHMPQPAFRFYVDIGTNRVGAFLDCKLPTLKWKTQEVKEGGLNTHSHELMGRRKKAKLTLKRGVGITADLLDWYVAVLNNQIIRKKVTITLADSRGVDFITWTIDGAFPITWKGPKLQTKSKAIAIETLSLSCGRITVEKGDQYR